MLTRILTLTPAPTSTLGWTLTLTSSCHDKIEVTIIHVRILPASILSSAFSVLSPPQAEAQTAAATPAVAATKAADAAAITQAVAII